MGKLTINHAKEPKSNYQIFILRQWQDAATAVWRFSLENPQTGQRYGFDRLEAMTEFLAACTSAQELEDTK